MSKKKSKGNSEKDVKETLLPDVVSGVEQIPIANEVKETDVILDSVVESQEQVAADMAERLEELSKRDTAGQIFNEEIHATTKDGKPSMTTSGKYRLKKQRKEIESEDELQRKSVSETSAGLYVQCGVTVFGDEWLPEDKKEFDRLVLAFDNYYKSVGIKYIPPSLGLIIGLGGYALKRGTKPNTKSLIDRAKNNIKNKLTKIFKRKKAIQ